jgi:hypothetical protein
MKRVAAAFVASLLATLPARAAAPILDEVPFVVTPDNVTLAMLEMARVGPGDFVIDLGSGDGRIVILAARRFGARGLGVELVEDLVRQSRESARRAGVADRAEFRTQDLFETDLSAATVVTLYLLPEVNLALRPRLLALKPGTRIVSHDWDMGDWKPDRTHVLDVPDKPVGLEKKSRVHLWIVPAQVGGSWCGTGSAAGTRLAIDQAYQSFTVTLESPGRRHVFRGRINGTVVRAGEMLILHAEGDRLKVAGTYGANTPLKGGTFERAATGAPCA